LAVTFAQALVGIVERVILSIQTRDEHLPLARHGAHAEVTASTGVYLDDFSSHLDEPGGDKE
jgi:hypothetical protein